MGYRLIALDIDGTIRSPEHPLSDRTRRAIASVGEAGAVVTLATGRMFRSALGFCSELCIASPIISYQGALVADPTSHQRLWHRPLTVDMARQALAALPSPSLLLVMAHLKDQVYVEKMTQWVQEYATRNQVTVNAVGGLSSFIQEEPTRLVLVGDEEEIDRTYLELRDTFDTSLHITKSLPQFCEILHPAGGKHSALAWLCDHLGISPEETLAFGNGPNDIGMLRWANLGIAMDGAPPEVVQAADRVAPPLGENGAAQVLEALLAQGQIGP